MSKASILCFVQPNGKSFSESFFNWKVAEEEQYKWRIVALQWISGIIILRIVVHCWNHIGRIWMVKLMLLFLSLSINKCICIIFTMLSFLYVVARSGTKEILRDHIHFKLGYFNMLPISLLILNLWFVILSWEAIALLKPMLMSLIVLANSSYTVDLSLVCFLLFLRCAGIH